MVFKYLNLYRHIDLILLPDFHTESELAEHGQPWKHCYEATSKKDFCMLLRLLEFSDWCRNIYMDKDRYI